MFLIGFRNIPKIHIPMVYLISSTLIWQKKYSLCFCIHSRAWQVHTCWLRQRVQLLPPRDFILTIMHSYQKVAQFKKIALGFDKSLFITLHITLTGAHHFIYSNQSPIVTTISRHQPLCGRVCAIGLWLVQSFYDYSLHQCTINVRWLHKFLIWLYIDN